MFQKNLSFLKQKDGLLFFTVQVIPRIRPIIVADIAIIITIIIRISIILEYGSVVSFHSPISNMVVYILFKIK